MFPTAVDQNTPLNHQSPSAEARSDSLRKAGQAIHVVTRWSQALGMFGWGTQVQAVYRS